jgi:UDP-2,4-diacetamido-2,4,6-trideoxy-beta-L-altropyranose hydrolase
MRCLTLAKTYQKDNVYFACEDLKGNLNHKIVEEGYTLHVLDDAKASTLNKLIQELKIDWLVIDNYDIKYAFEKKVKAKTGVKILSFDDVYEKHFCDVLLNHNVYAKKNEYKRLVPDFCDVRCGAKYTLIRDEFKCKQKKSRNKKTIFISIGGTDHLGLNIDILKILKKACPKYKLYVVTSSANKRLKKLKNFCHNKKNIQLYVDSKKMAKLMSQSAFAIVTPSVVVHEVLHMKLPFLAIKTVKNQKYMYKYLKKNNYKVLKTFSKKRLKHLLSKAKPCIS